MAVVATIDDFVLAYAFAYAVDPDSDPSFAFDDPMPLYPPDLHLEKVYPVDHKQLECSTVPKHFSPILRLAWVSWWCAISW